MISAAAAVLAVSLGALPACGKSPYSPGTPLGTFSITAKVTSNNCMAVPNPWTFDVNLAEDPGELYWIQNDVPVEGEMSSSGAVSLTSTSSLTVDPADDAGNGGCAMQRVDTLTGTTSGSPITGLTGTLTYVFSATSGSCDDQLEANGGTYYALPCTLAYDITATRTVAPATTSTASNVRE